MTHPSISVWLLLAVGAAFLWATSNLIDADLVNRQRWSPSGITAMTGLAGALPGLVLIFSGGLMWPGFSTAILGLSAGVAAVFVYIPYFFALRRESTPAVLLMWNLSPVFAAGMSAAFLRERPGALAAVGLALLVTSAVIASWKTGAARRRLSRASSLMLAASVMSAMDVVLHRALFQRISFAAGLVWATIGMLLVTVLLCLRPATRANIRMAVSWKKAPLLLTNQALDVAAATAVAYATALAPAGPVSAVGGLQPLFVIAIGTVAFRIGVGGTSLPLSEAIKLGAASLLAIAGLALVNGMT